MKPAPTVRRDSDLVTRAFPFELLHARGPATNMRAFHWHDFVELSFVRSGRGTYEIEEKTFRVGPGDMIIINDTERHRVTYRAAEPLHETVLHFAPALLALGVPGGPGDPMRLFRYDGAAFANKPRLSPPARRALRRLVGEIGSEWEARRPWHEVAVRAKLLDIVALLLRECGVRGPGTPAAAAARRRTIARLEEVLAWMREGFRRPIGLAEAARRFSLRASYLSDFIRRNLGVTFTEFLAHLRVEEAARLLAEGRGSTEAAFASGFNTTAGFYAAFKRVMGVNPGEWLRRTRSKGA